MNPFQVSAHGVFAYRARFIIPIVRRGLAAHIIRKGSCKMESSVEPEIVMQETKRSVERVREELKCLESVLRLEREELLVLEALHDQHSAETSSTSQ